MDINKHFKNDRLFVAIIVAMSLVLSCFLFKAMDSPGLMQAYYSEKIGVVCFRASGNNGLVCTPAKSVNTINLDNKKWTKI